MKLTLLLNLTVIILGLSGCTRYAYYQSPFHGNTSTYRTIPLRSDSSKSAFYVSGAYLGGGANENDRDGYNGFTWAAYRSHQFGYFDAYYGITGTLGNYTVKPYDSLGYYDQYNQNINTALINKLAGNKFFGGLGAIGGVNFVVPMGRTGEWRIGVEGNWQREFGEYLDFRNKLPDTAANLIDRKAGYMTISFGSDLVFKTRHGSIGIKMTSVHPMRRETYFDGSRIPSRYTSGYFSQTFHLTVNRITGFWQVNFGDHIAASQLGLNFRLGRLKGF